jgi:hypothetical protein
MEAPMAHTTSALDIVKQAYAAFGRADVPAVMAHVADGADCTFFGAKGLPYTDSFHGKEQIARWFMSTGEHVTVWDGSVPRARRRRCSRVRDGLIVRFWGMYDTEASARAR